MPVALTALMSAHSAGVVGTVVVKLLALLLRDPRIDAGVIDRRQLNMIYEKTRNSDIRLNILKNEKFVRSKIARGTPLDYTAHRHIHAAILKQAQQDPAAPFDTLKERAEQELEQKVSVIQRQVKEYIYRPGGPFFQKAMQDFNQHTKQLERP